MKINRDIEIQLDRYEICIPTQSLIVRFKFDFCEDTIQKRERLEFDEEILPLIERLQEWINKKIQ